MKCKHLREKMFDVHDIDWDYAFFRCLDCGNERERKMRKNEIKDAIKINDGDIKILKKCKRMSYGN